MSDISKRLFPLFFNTAYQILKKKNIYTNTAVIFDIKFCQLAEKKERKLYI